MGGKMVKKLITLPVWQTRIFWICTKNIGDLGLYLDSKFGKEQ